MERKEVFKKVTEIARDIFENDEIALTEATSSADVEEWDSLAHLSLISDLEDEFDITFTMSEISGSKNLGALVDALMKHIGEK